ncbi:MAG: hypothetical protein LBT40_09250 [Deltaproteobacteria bacterium]|nr:hypothetical protein [Deltaproteobacteria bacterium]
MKIQINILPFTAAIYTAALFTALALCSLLVPGTASAQDGWLPFQSWEVRTTDLPQFTLRYPPGFERQAPQKRPEADGSDIADGAGDEGDGGTKALQAFGMADSSNGRIYFLTVSADRFPREQNELLETMGASEYWNGLGSSAAGPILGKFDEAKVFEKDGLSIAEMFFTKDPVYGSSNPYVTYSIQHAVRKGDYLVVLDCFLDAPLQVSIQGGFTSTDNPAIAQYCTPFFDSLEFTE